MADVSAERVHDSGAVEKRRHGPALPEEQGPEDEEILGPLRGAQRHDEAKDGRPIGLSLIRDG